MTPYYEQDGITIYHGDCRDGLPLRESRSFDLVMADPPYGQTSLSWDKWPTGWLQQVSRWSASLWCFGSLRMFLDRRPEFVESGWALSQDIIWEKHNGSSFHADRFRRVHEQAAHFYRGAWEDVYKWPQMTNDATARTVRRKGRPKHMGQIEASSYASVDGGPRLMTSVIYSRSMHGSAENETQKPQAVVAPLIEYACKPHGLILVPFVGSGTDLEIAKLTGRGAVGFEVREDQCEKAALRLSKMLPLEITHDSHVR